MKSLKIIASVLLLILVVPAAAFAQAGKIVGTVTDAATGEPLPGVNVVIVGTQQGATTNIEGNYTILNVSPGSYDVRASFVGFAPVTQEGVNVNIDLTTEVNFEMQEQTEELEEVTVQATEPVVKKDISANVANLSSEEIENLPVSSIEEVVGLQAGMEGLSVRGSNLSEVSFVVDGMSYTNPRNNTPFTGISYTSVDEVQVQTGGFNAEYGNVRSGLINVVTKEGPRDHYTADVLLRYSPPQEKYDGIPLNSTRAYWWRPFFSTLPEDENAEGQSVGFVGTDSEESPWDRYTRRQYPEFEGWNTISEQLNNDDNPNNDLTPEQVRQVSLFRHRKDVGISEPDYEIDGSIGGPVPGISDYLGDLRFFGSYRQTQSAYIVPQLREGYMDRTGQLKLTSNVASGMKLTLHGMYAKQMGLSSSDIGGTGMWQGDGGMAYSLDEGDYRRPIFAFHRWNPMDVTRNLVGLDLTHTLGSNTFYEVSVQRMGTRYHTYRGEQRSSDVVEQIGPMELSEAPFGYEAASLYDYTDLRLSGDWHQARDSSKVARWTASADITSQLNQYMQLKSGVEFIYNDYVTQHQAVDPWYVYREQSYRWERSPMQGAAYVQNKFEFEGLVANVGVRLDYFNPTTEDWYAHDEYERIFAAYLGFDEIGNIEQTEVPAQWALSPRLGLSFPVTENSKLFFNYGHFRQMLNPENLFVVRRAWNGAVDYIGNPRHPMPRTVAYELGYEHNLFDLFLLRATGYYKRLGQQTRNVNFESADGLVDYYVGLPNNYEDIRGLELTLRKNSGRWFRGFVNYTYMAHKSGEFGYGVYYENLVQQRQYERNYTGYRLSSPVPQPYARINLEFIAPSNFGPQVAGISPLGDWRLSLLGSWSSGSAFTWAGGGGITIEGLRNNVRWEGDYDLDLRLAKNFNVMQEEVQFYVDVSNVLEMAPCCGAGFQGPNDQEHYLQSLHLPGGIFEDVEREAPYRWIEGDDQPGDFRSYDTEFVPIEIVDGVGSVNDPMTRPLYYDWEAKEYMQYRDGAFEEADEEYVDSVLENKQYIDMPNQRSLTFLEPRRVRFGLRVTL